MPKTAKKKKPKRRRGLAEVFALGGGRTIDAQSMLAEMIARMDNAGIILVAIGEDPDDVDVRLFGEGSAASVALVRSILDERVLDLYYGPEDDGDDDDPPA
jgi:hypothetical protein